MACFTFAQNTWTISILLLIIFIEDVRMLVKCIQLTNLGPTDIKQSFVPL